MRIFNAIAAEIRLELEILWIRVRYWNMKRANDRLVGKMAKDLGMRKADLWEIIQRW